MIGSEWVGRELGEYFVFEKVGSGSMAEVYKALQPSMDRLVAIKLISPSLSNDSHFVARFRREAKIAATLEHPHILPVIDFGEQDDVLYLVMRYVNGGTLHDLIQKGPLPPPVVLRYITEIGEALDYAHGLRVVHRDIKPKNVLLDAQGNPFIADFGLAKLVGGGAITGSGMGMIGTPHYMSPEQARAQHVDGRSDLYSLGVVLFQMLTGKVPFDADSTVGIVMKHIGEAVPDVTKFNPDLTSSLNSVLSKTMAKHPADRHQTAHELTEALARALGTSVISGPILSRSLSRSGERTLGAGNPLDDLRADLYRASITFRRWVRPRRRLRLAREKMASSWEDLKNSAYEYRRSLTWLGGLAILASLVVLGGPLANAARPAPSPTSALPTSTLPVIVPPTVVAPPTNTTLVTAVAPTPSPGPPTPIVTKSIVIADQDAMALVYISAGNFLLGSSDSDPDAREDEKPQQVAYLDAFWMDRTEVTVAQFQDFVNATAYQTDAERGCCVGNYDQPGGIVFSPNAAFVRNASWKQPEGGGGNLALPRRPVVQVSWNDAKAYCEWAGRRLPTEAEWDKAARGSDGRLYPWGNEFLENRVNFCDASCAASWRDTAYDDKFARTSNVGSYPDGASPYGLLDMTGNALEWVNDFYDFRGYYRYVFANPVAPTPTSLDGATHALRGGSWIDSLDRVRASARWAMAPDGRNNLTGFRCAADAAAIP